MGHSALPGSATILAFRPKPTDARIFQGRPADVAQLIPRHDLALEMSPPSVVDIDGWYHAEAVHNAPGVRH